jgi:hypothetical protein
MRQAGRPVGVEQDWIAFEGSHSSLAAILARIPPAVTLMVHGGELIVAMASLSVTAPLIARNTIPDDEKWSDEGGCRSDEQRQKDVGLMGGSQGGREEDERGW